MPKLKTHSGAKKRFRVTASGRFKRKRAGTRHILTKKSSGRMRHLTKSGMVHKTDEDRLRTLLPYA